MAHLPAGHIFLSDTNNMDVALERPIDRRLIAVLNDCVYANLY